MRVTTKIWDVFFKSSLSLLNRDFGHGWSLAYLAINHSYPGNHFDLIWPSLVSPRPVRGELTSSKPLFM